MLQLLQHVAELAQEYGTYTAWPTNKCVALLINYNYHEDYDMASFLLSVALIKTYNNSKLKILSPEPNDLLPYRYIVAHQMFLI